MQLSLSDQYRSANSAPRWIQAKASPSKVGAAFDVVNDRDKRVKELPRGRFGHKREDGVTCHHTFQVRDGKIIDLDYNRDGSKQVVVGTPQRKQVKRAREGILQEPRYRTNVRYTVECRHGEFDMWISPHKEWGDDGRKMAEHYRVFPEGDPVYKVLYGVARNTSEGGNAHPPQEYVPTQARSGGWTTPILLEVYLYFITENAKTWYFQGGFRTVDSVLHGADESMVSRRRSAPARKREGLFGMMPTFTQTSSTTSRLRVVSTSHFCQLRS